jgi:hypothetical protein
MVDGDGSAESRWHQPKKNKKNEEFSGCGRNSLNVWINWMQTWLFTLMIQVCTSFLGRKTATNLPVGWEWFTSPISGKPLNKWFMCIPVGIC